MTLPLLDTDMLSRLFGTAAEVSEQGELRNVLQSIVHSAISLTRARYGALGVVGSDGYLVEFIHEGMDEETVELIGHHPIGIGVLGTITRTGAVVRLDHIADHPDSSGFPEHHPHMESFLGVPVRTGSQVFGNLYLTEKDGGFTEADEQAMELLAMIGGLAVANARIHERMRRIAVNEDRARIARDVHDDTIQDLFAVGLSLQALASATSDAGMADALRQEVTRIDGCITSLRNLIFGLRRSEPDRLLTDEVDELVDEMAQAHGGRARVRAEGVFDTVPMQVSEAVLHIVKEAVSNAFRHSGSSWVEVVLFGAPSSITISVNDGGRGFDPASQSTGQGLANLQARAAAVGGTLEVLTAPGRGTMLRASIPTEPPRQEGWTP